MSLDLLLAALLRCVGAFYLVAALLGLRAVAMDAFLSKALDALAPEEPQVRAADRLRWRYLVASTILTGLGAVALVALLTPAFPLFLLTSAFQVGYLALVAPRAVDPSDPPEPAERRRSWKAAAVYAAATAFVGAAAWAGLLRPVVSDLASALAGAGALALLGYAAWLLKPGTRLPGMRPEPESGSRDVGRSADTFDTAAEPDLERLSIVLTPSWGDGGVLDVATGRALPYETVEQLLRPPERDLIQDWLCLFREVADPTDPRRCRLRAEGGLARLEALGKPIHEELAARLGPDRVGFEPQPRPKNAVAQFGAVKLMAEHGCHPLWHADGRAFGCFAPEDAGLSWSLARSLDEWSMAHDEANDPADPGGASKWSADERRAHAEEGFELAERLRHELRATGRGHVRVSYQPEAGEEVGL